MTAYGRAVTTADSSSSTAYEALFQHVLRRIDPERAHQGQGPPQVAELSDRFEA